MYNFFSFHDGQPPFQSSESEHIDPVMLTEKQHLRSHHESSQRFISTSKLLFCRASQPIFHLDANVYSKILEEGLRRGPPDAPIAQRTSLGWILSGPVAADDEQPTSQVSSFQCTSDFELSTLMQKFWIQEDTVQMAPSLSPDEIQCDNHFIATHIHASDGRFIVQLPLRTLPATFGDSKDIALRMLLHDWPLQQILWRESSHDKIRSFVLCTVTYGLACAPYLALRCLHQLADENSRTHPRAANIIRRQSYVDDILAGADSIEDAQESIRQIQHVLRAGGFPLRKWMANCPAVLAQIPEQDREEATLSLDDRTFRTLGIS
ncbi:hypothetical protein DMN91_008224 [Ooceraea biroi]|uniref:Reverse transcriptase domain-containing protein n=1 Tax=Ooceraea biroi TaxID=2015173 RepID=A0A3L8DGU2_OOCBI|nr:hypothetical protein DMN91_008224 [Ooceraea biroi]